MMYRKFIQLLGMTLILLAGAACSREEVPAADGTVTINFRVGDADTKAVSPGDGNVADGGGIYCHRAAGPPVVLTPDLYIFICDWETGALVKRYPGDADDDGNEDGNVDPDSDWADSKSTFLSVSFPFNVEGTYSVYALANVSGGDSNLNLPDILTTLATVTNASQLDALLISLAASAPDVGSRMPLSAKGSLNVVKGLTGDKYNGYVELQMLRCFNKVQFSFKNLTGSELNLYNCQITLKDLNVQQGWLFPTSPDFAPTGEDENSDGKDDNYRDFTSGIVEVTGIAQEGEKSFFANPVVFLPSVAPSQTHPSKGQRYLVDISFRVPKTDVYDSGNSATYDEKSFTNLPIHTPKSLDIKSLERNQYLQIVTTVSKGETVSFNFRVKEWEEHTEYVTFD